MREPGAEPTEGERPTQGEQPKHRSQRPPAPLTHRMDLRSVREAYWEAGLCQPELERRRPGRPDRQITRDKPSASNQEQETRLMEPENATTSTKPTVGGTHALHNARVQAVVSEGQKCLMYGGTIVVSGGLLMIAWKGITRWLG